jgi:tetratricopeptide (TPR) repeat protein
MSGMGTNAVRVASLAFFFLGSIFGQVSGHVHEPQTEDQTNPEQLPPPRPMKGIGNAALQITANPEAQRWFNQGLNLIHDFWDYESARAFEQGIRSDRRCAMCYWGLYQALSFFHGNNQGYAGEALKKAVELRTGVTEHERLYIEATAEGVTHQNTIALWRELSRKYPDDLQAKLYLSMHSPHAESLALLHSILEKRPDDSAANHYLIHALEATDQADQALASASILPRLAPRSGHMVHMPGHIYFVLGKYEMAEKPFAASTRVDERYMREQHIRPDDDWNYVHNLMYSVANFMEEGKLKSATELSSHKLPAARGHLESTLYTYQPRDSVSRIDPQLPVALRTADWEKIRAILSETSVPEQWPNLQFLAQELLSFAHGMQAYEHGKLEEAESARNTFDSELENARSRAKSLRHPQDVAPKPQRALSPDALLPSLLGTLSVMSDELRGWSQALSGKLDEATATFDRAAAEQKSLGYREPPAFIRPARESEGDAFLQIGDPSRAADAYRAALKQRPHSGFALYGLALSAERAKEASAARDAYVEFLTEWRHADSNLPQVAHAKEFVRKQKA